MTKLNDPLWLTKQHQTNKKSITEISKMLEVAHSTVGLYFKRHNIQVINFRTSQAERDILDYIISISGHPVISGTKSVIPPQELDIYIPNMKLAIEFNGLFWHSELNGKDKTYHLQKTIQCQEQGIRLIHVLEHEWANKQDIVKSRLANMFGKSKTIYARKCSIVELDTKTKDAFMIENHIQGKCASSYNYGLVHENELVSVMTFGTSRFSKRYEYELLRYANKKGTSTIGGASRLFQHFRKMILPQSVVSYSDKRWNTGELYITLGFTHSHDSAPNYFYFNLNNEMEVFSRNKFQKHKLKNLLENFDPSQTEWQNMQNHEFDRIWDCGNAVFVWNS